MIEVILKFMCEEYVQCFVKICWVMDEKGVDLLIVSDFLNMNWLIGYDGWFFYVY